MTRESALERVNSVFRDVFDDEELNVGPETTAADVDGWDSLEHINLILAIETEFGVKFTVGEVSGMKNVGEMIDIICTRSTC